MINSFVIYVAFDLHKLRGCMKTQVVRIREKDYERLSQYKKETGIPIAETIHRAVDEYLERMNTQKTLIDQLRHIDYDQLIQILKNMHKED